MDKYFSTKPFMDELDDSIDRVKRSFNRMDSIDQFISGITPYYNKTYRDNIKEKFNSLGSNNLYKNDDEIKDLLESYKKSMDPKSEDYNSQVDFYNTMNRSATQGYKIKQEVDSKNIDKDFFSDLNLLYNSGNEADVTNSSIYMLDKYGKRGRETLDLYANDKGLSYKQHKSYISGIVASSEANKCINKIKYLLSSNKSADNYLMIKKTRKKLEKFLKNRNIPSNISLDIKRVLFEEDVKYGR